VFLLENQIELVKIFRQTDSVYSSMLNQIREGVIKKKTNEFLLGYVGREMDKKWVTSHPTQLFPTRNKVETINNNKMASLTGDAKLFTLERRTDCEMSKFDAYLRDSFTEKDIAYELDSLAGNIICDAVLYLKKGAQVMSVVNIQNDKGLEICNGSQGIVIGFCEVSGLPRVKFNNGIEMTMARHTWISEKIPGIGVSQVPLILAWALTIHKSQGATLDMAEIDVGSGIFECGQTYVALSRVKSLEGLYLTSFDAKRIRINKKVKEYYQQLREYRLKNPWNLSLITETESLDKKGYKEQCVIVEAVLELVPELVPELVYENTSLFSEYNYVEAELN
jgi:ATP-dependent DNA helicase PIF1